MQKNQSQGNANLWIKIGGIAMKNIKIVNKNKFIRAITFIIIIGIFLLFIGFTQSYSNTEMNCKTEYVLKGDTLWSIATNELKNNEYYEGKDVRKVIYEIRKINHLKNSELVEGTPIKIPIY